MYKTLQKLVLNSALLATLFHSSLIAANNDAMVKSLMKLRSQTELFHTRMEDEKDSYQTTMKSLALQKNDLDAQINRKITFLKELQQDSKKLQALIKKRSQEDNTLKPLLVEALKNLKEHIKASIAFKTSERLGDLAQLEDQIKAELITPQKALARLWSSYEDTLRLTKENGIFKQVIKLNNEDLLVEVAKIGMMMIFFKTPDDRVGYLKDGYYVETIDETERVEVLALFDAIKKQIRTGFFSLPNTLTMEVK